VKKILDGIEELKKGNEADKGVSKKRKMDKEGENVSNKRKPEIASIKGYSSDLQKQLLAAVTPRDGSCVVSKTAISLSAAHIYDNQYGEVSYQNETGHYGIHGAENLLLMTVEMNKAYDNMYFGIKNDGTIVVSKYVPPDVAPKLAAVDGTRISNAALIGKKNGPSPSCLKAKFDKFLQKENERKGKNAALKTSGKVSCPYCGRAFKKQHLCKRVGKKLKNQNGKVKENEEEDNKEDGEDQGEDNQGDDEDQGEDDEDQGEDDEDQDQGEDDEDLKEDNKEDDEEDKMEDARRGKQKNTRRGKVDRGEKDQ